MENNLTDFSKYLDDRYDEYEQKRFDAKMDRNYKLETNYSIAADTIARVSYWYKDHLQAIEMVRRVEVCPDCLGKITVIDDKRYCYDCGYFDK